MKERNIAMVLKMYQLEIRDAIEIVIYWENASPWNNFETTKPWKKDHFYKYYLLKNQYEGLITKIICRISGVCLVYKYQNWFWNNRFYFTKACLIKQYD